MVLEYSICSNCKTVQVEDVSLLPKQDVPSQIYPLLHVQRPFIHSPLLPHSNAFVLQFTSAKIRNNHKIQKGNESKSPYNYVHKV